MDVAHTHTAVGHLESVHLGSSQRISKLRVTFSQTPKWHFKVNFREIGKKVTNVLKSKIELKSAMLTGEE